MIILDSCILIEIQRGNKAIIEKIYEYNQHDLFTTPIVVAEFYRGARNKQEFSQCKRLIKKFSVLAINKEVTEVFTDFFDKFAISHRPSIPDMLIAATAIHYNFSIFTLNKKDFRFINNLTLIDIDN